MKKVLSRGQQLFTCRSTVKHTHSTSLIQIYTFCIPVSTHCRMETALLCSNAALCLQVHVGAALRTLMTDIYPKANNWRYSCSSSFGHSSKCLLKWFGNVQGVALSVSVRTVQRFQVRHFRINPSYYIVESAVGWGVCSVKGHAFCCSEPFGRLTIEYLKYTSKHTQNKIHKAFIRVSLLKKHSSLAISAGCTG